MNKLTILLIISLTMHCLGQDESHVPDESYVKGTFLPSNYFVHVSEKKNTMTCYRIENEKFVKQWSAPAEYELYRDVALSDDGKFIIVVNSISKDTAIKDNPVALLIYSKNKLMKIYASELMDISIKKIDLDTLVLTSFYSLTNGSIHTVRGASLHQLIFEGKVDDKKEYLAGKTIFGDKFYVELETGKVVRIAKKK